MQSNETAGSSAINQWLALNRILFIYKTAGAALVGVCLLLVFLCLILSARKPVVAIISGEDYIMVQGKRTGVDLNEANIQRFIERYVRLSREWKTLDPDKIAQNIAPLVTDGFRSKALAMLKERKDKEFVGKMIREDVSGLSVDVTKESTVAVFDAILRVDGIPLIVPTQVSFELVRGPSSEWNPLGLYVNSETLHEGK